jgi:glycyl-tRNA synthetase alpha subunit
MTNCICITSSGKKCKRPSLKGSKYCFQHHNCKSLISDVEEAQKQCDIMLKMNKKIYKKGYQELLTEEQLRLLLVCYDMVENMEKDDILKNLEKMMDFTHEKLINLRKELGLMEKDMRNIA